MSWTSKSEMMETLNSLEEKFDHLLYTEGGAVNQINLRLTAIESKLAELDLWRVGLLNHITVAITTPAASSTQYGTITVTATANDILAHVISKLEFYLDDIKFAEDAASPYTVSLGTTQYSNASHVLRVNAYCTTGGWGTLSETITINNVIPTGGTTVGGGTASYGDVVSVRILSPTPGSRTPLSFQLVVLPSCSAEHPISSVVCGSVVGGRCASPMPGWLLYVSFDSTKQYKKTFTITVTCAHGTTGTARTTYYNLSYDGPPPGGMI